MEKHPASTLETRDDFVHFVRTYSPQADANSVLLFKQFHRAHHLLEQMTGKNLDSVGLSWAKFRVLMNLMSAERDGNIEGLQPSVLSERQDISRNTMSALISSLERDGLISRELHGEDHRKFLIHLTPRGQALIHAQLADQFKCISDCFETLSERDHQQLLDLLNRLNIGLSAKARQCK